MTDPASSHAERTENGNPVAERRLKFPRSRRLTSNKDFERIYALKCRASDVYLLIFAARNETGLNRIGLSVSRKHGNSVVRHRLRRLLKEAYRLAQHDIPEGLDLILIPQQGGEFDVQGLMESMKRLTHKLARRLQRPPGD